MDEMKLTDQVENYTQVKLFKNETEGGPGSSGVSERVLREAKIADIKLEYLRLKI